MKNTKAHRQALEIMRKSGCDKDAYEDCESIRKIIKDIRMFLNEKWNEKLKQKYIDADLKAIADEILAISKAEGAKRRKSAKKRYMSCWETDDSCDGSYYSSLEDAAGTALSTLENWAVDEHLELQRKIDCGEITEQEAVDDWNYMIYSCMTWVMIFDKDKNDYVDYWYPSQKECEEHLWKTMDKWTTA